MPENPAGRRPLGSTIANSDTSGESVTDPLETGAAWGSDPITAALGALHDLVRPESGGEVASYIPELANADPGQFGIALVSLVGHRYAAGDAEVPFTIQSISKPFVYALALADEGLEGVLARVGAEPSGEAFNAISLDPTTGRPPNPMVNAGAIVTTSLVRASSADARFERIRTVLSAFAGRELGIDEAVYRSERDTGDRNRALAYLMRSAGSLREPVDQVLDAYFRQCAVEVTTVDLAVMAATLAAGGSNPVTGEVVVSREIAEQTCALMASCGMYDYAGEWWLRVGLPAKSGVSGGLIATSPGQFGIGVFSPPLDSRGNSVRAVEASRLLAERFSLQLVHRPDPTNPIVSFDRQGSTTEAADGREVAVLRLQGDLEFTAAEIVLSAIEPLRQGIGDRPRWLVLDVGRVTRLHPVAAAVMGAMTRGLAARGTTLVVVDPLERRLLPARDEFASLDEAIVQCKGRGGDPVSTGRA
jgi:glutaminase